MLLKCFKGCTFDDICAALALDPKELSGDDSAAPVLKKPVAPVRPDLPQLLEQMQSDLPGSLGEVYLANRGFSLEIAQKFGLGYATNDTWPGRRALNGRLVFPHLNPDGRIINLYGRAVDFDDVPKQARHDHLPGNKGFFNAPTIRRAARHGAPLYVCEGSFDALALMAYGIEHAIAIFGVNGWRSEWIAGQRRIVFAFDNDETGIREVEKLRKPASFAADLVERLAASAYGDRKDVAKAFEDGVLSAG